MSTSARVDSIDSIKEFRAYLAKFQEGAGRALGDAESDVNRMVMWLEGEGLTFWTGQIRKRQEVLAKAEEALRFKRLYKDASGSTPSAVEEMKAVQVAKKNLADAQEKQSNVKRWTRQIQKEIILYKGGVARFQNAVSSGVPHAIAQLGSTIEMLEEYTGIAPAGIGGEGAETAAAGAAGGEGAEPSMARAAEEVPQEEAAALDPAQVRAIAPTAEQMASAQPLPKGPVRLAGAKLSDQSRKALAVLAGAVDQLGDDALVVVTPQAISASSIYLLRPSDDRFAWCIGQVDGGGGRVYNTIRLGDLRAGRPELAEALRLPEKSLVVITDGEIAAVYNEHNENVLPSPTEQE